MAKRPMIGVTGVPMLGPGGKPLVCEDGVVCCDNPIILTCGHIVSCFINREVHLKTALEDPDTEYFDCDWTRMNDTWYQMTNECQTQGFCCSPIWGKTLVNWLELMQAICPDLPQFPQDWEDHGIFYAPGVNQEFFNHSSSPEPAFGWKASVSCRGEDEARRIRFSLQWRMYESHTFTAPWYCVIAAEFTSIEYTFDEIVDLLDQTVIDIPLTLLPDISSAFPFGIDYFGPDSEATLRFIGAPGCSQCQGEPPSIENFEVDILNGCRYRVRYSALPSTEECPIDFVYLKYITEEGYVTIIELPMDSGTGTGTGTDGSVEGELETVLHYGCGPFGGPTDSLELHVWDTCGCEAITDTVFEGCCSCTDADGNDCPFETCGCEGEEPVEVTFDIDGCFATVMLGDGCGFVYVLTGASNCTCDEIVNDLCPESVGGGGTIDLNTGCRTVTVCVADSLCGCLACHEVELCPEGDCDCCTGCAAGNVQMRVSGITNSFPECDCAAGVDGLWRDMAFTPDVNQCLWTNTVETSEWVCFSNPFVATFNYEMVLTCDIEGQWWLRVLFAINDPQTACDRTTFIDILVSEDVEPNCADVLNGSVTVPGSPGLGCYCNYGDLLFEWRTV